MNILLLGANGMLGHAIQDVFSDHTLTCWDQAQLDITDEAAVKEKIPTVTPELIINAAAFTDVDACETNEEMANRVNGEAVGYLGAMAHRLKIPIVHMSTDYVFDGTKKEGYSENDLPNPINAYGRSKLLGERRLLSNTHHYYLIRTAWLYGPNGKNFVDTIIKLAAEKNKLQVVNDQYGNPTYTYELARSIKQMVENKIAYGIYHRTNDGVATWYDFAKAIVSLKGITTPVEPVSSRQFPRPAKRPSYSVLVSSKLPVLEPWENGLAEYLNR